ncbi:MAG: bifunctional diaminohydroxyphosphoribosylaminopyrimidine deaminase/5-amino-6-(5-phosphoribosylamino)uracil reductase RibD [Verrucomicrobiota bacterium]
MTPNPDELYMQQAIDTAMRAWGDTHPNPMVGALIVKNDEVIAEGCHLRAGESHAEVAAFMDLGFETCEDSTLYVTLEPCSTHGRTGPCTEVIIESGIQRVVVGAIDPNPKHAGEGLTILREAGIEVAHGVLAEECAEMNFIFNHAIVNDSPLMAGKVAMTMDGKIATRSSHSHWVTGTEAREDVMRWRRLFPAIAVGAGTLIADNPSLTARLPGVDPFCHTRFVFDRQLLSVDHLDKQVFNDEWREKTVVITQSDASPEGLQKLKDHGIVCWQPSIEPSEAFFHQFERKCLDLGINGVLVEGGSGLLSDLLAEKRLDYLLSYRAPKILADDQALPAFRGITPDKISDAITLEEIKHTVFGPDVLTRGYIVYPE